MMMQVGMNMVTLQACRVLKKIKDNPFYVVESRRLNDLIHRMAVAEQMFGTQPVILSQEEIDLLGYEYKENTVG